MAMVVLLVPADCRDVTLGTGEASRLAQLGVTCVSLVHNLETVAMVLEGWAFDPAGSLEAVHEVLGESAGLATVLHQVAQFSLSPTPAPSRGARQ